MCRVRKETERRCCPTYNPCLHNGADVNNVCREKLKYPRGKAPTTLTAATSYAT